MRVSLFFNHDQFIQTTAYSDNSLFRQQLRQTPRQTMSLKKSSLRSTLRSKRQAIAHEERNLANKNISTCLRKLNIYRASKHVGVYINSPFEAPTDSLVAQNKRWQKSSYTPVITSLRNSHMRFAKVTSKTCFRKNSLGIIEPLVPKSKLYSALKLDIIFLPLVGFDRDCNRLGMGKGFYDRFLQHRLTTTIFKKPVLIGLAFDEQEVNNVPIDRWDVPLDGIVTSSGKIIWKPST